MKQCLKAVSHQVRNAQSILSEFMDSYLSNDVSLEDWKTLYKIDSDLENIELEISKLFRKVINANDETT